MPRTTAFKVYGKFLWPPLPTVQPVLDPVAGTVEVFFVDAPLEGFSTSDVGNPEGGRFGSSSIDRRSSLRDRRNNPWPGSDGDH